MNNKVKKKRGMTLVEVVITLAIMAIASSVIYLLFSSSNRSINDTDLKSQLQYELQVVQEKLSTIGVESTGIKQLSSDAALNTSKIVFRKPAEEVTTDTSECNEYIFELNSGEMTLREKLITITESGGVKTETSTDKGTKILSKDVEAFKVELLNETDYTKTKSIKIEITLKGKKGTSTKDLKGTTIVAFRNYGLE